MKASEANLLPFLRKSIQFAIPIYQRTYSWTETECQQLWDDILHAGSDDRIKVHFIGSIVYIEDGLSQVSHQSSLLVIDGQQRLTTITLLLAALAEAVGEEEPLDGFSAIKIRDSYLTNHLEKGDRHFKLILSQNDAATLKAIVKPDSEMPQEISVRVKENFEFFQEKIAALRERLPVLCEGLKKLVLVDIALNRDYDNPQLIFESMNSTGRELSQADLIRNYILMGQEQAFQTDLYERYWRQMERMFGQEAYARHFDAFMRHYLTVKTGTIPRLDDIYDAFKKFSRGPSVEESGVEALLKDMRTFAEYYCAMALGKETDKELDAAFHDLRELKVNVAYPFLLELYHDYKKGRLSKADFNEIIRLVETYVFRRAISAIPPNSLDKTFATFARSLKKEKYLEEVKAVFLLMSSYRRFPSDEEFKRDIQTRDLYNFRSRSYWLRRFENHKRKEYVPVDDYTIEHIMPQCDPLPPTWQAELGSEWERIHKEYLHTLGNLTLTGYNSEYSNHPFAKKRDMPNGFRDSPLRLSAGLGQVETWSEEAIKERAKRLADQAVNVWPAPELEEGLLDIYKKGSNGAKISYTRADHPHLLKEPSQTLFNKLKQEVLALDPNITEEYLKFYVAFKAETNFVDVIPQAKGLRLVLNMPFSDISDSQNKCRDISEIGRWGNGDVEVRFDQISELPYIMGLIRQSFERQMQNTMDA